MQSKMRKLITLLAIVASFGCNASNEDRVAFGLTLLSEKFTEFEARHSICINLSKSNTLSTESVKALKELPSSVGESLGFLSLKAIRECSSPEYNEVLRVLLSLESANKKVNNESANKKINTLKSLMFPVTEFNAEKKFSELPQELKNKLLMIKELNEPFNMLDGFERAWLN
jgi:hypothetical protein